MLIVTSKAPGWGQQKPKQYNLAHAQASVRHNCEDWLGVPYESLKLCLPFWEGAGNTIHNIVGNDAHFGSGESWEKNYAKTTSSNYGITIDNSEEIRPTDSFTLHIDIKRFNAIIDKNGKIFQKDLSVNPYVSYGMEFYYGSSIYLFKAVNSSYTDNRLLYSTGGLGVGNRLKITGVAGSRGLEIYRDDALVASDVSITGNIAYYENAPLKILGDGTSTTKLTEADVNQALMFDADLTSEQVAAIDKQPYALLQPVAPVFYSLPSALVPRITYPTEGLNDVSTTPTISWSAVTGATKYKLQVDTANTFDSSAGLPLIEDEIVGGAGLLILDSHSATYKATQKPKQWGPLSAVQDAVRHNCEELLGFDSNILTALTPMWDNLGLIDIVSGTYPVPVGSVSMATKNKGVFSSSTDLHTNYYEYTDLTGNDSASDPFSIFMAGRIGLATGTDASKGLCGLSFGDGYSQFLTTRKSYTDDTSIYNYISFNRTQNTPLNLVPANFGGSIKDNSEIIAVGTLNGDDGNLWAKVEGNKAYIGGSCGSSTSSRTKVRILGAPYSTINSAENESTTYISAIFKGIIPPLAAETLIDRPFCMLQPTNNRIISIGSSTPATSKQVTLAAGTTHYARVAADTP